VNASCICLEAFAKTWFSAAATLRSLTAAGTATLGAVCIFLYVYFRVAPRIGLYRLAGGTAKASSAGRKRWLLHKTLQILRDDR
jgi:hypothetical protein